MNHFARNTSTGLAWEEICQADKEGIDLSKHNLYRYLSQKQINWKELISKKLLPDEAYLVNNELKVYEKKFQQTPGSVDEKLQTCALKFFSIKKLEELQEFKKLHILIFLIIGFLDQNIKTF